MKTYHIMHSGAKADSWVCKMMGDSAVGITYHWYDRLQYKTLNGAIRGMRRLYKNGLINDKWFVYGPSPVRKGMCEWDMKDQKLLLGWK